MGGGEMYISPVGDSEPFLSFYAWRDQLMVGLAGATLAYLSTFGGSFSKSGSGCPRRSVMTASSFLTPSTLVTGAQADVGPPPSKLPENFLSSSRTPSGCGLGCGPGEVPSHAGCSTSAW